MEKSTSIYIRILIVIVILIVVNILAHFIGTSFDLTEEKRFTLTDHTVATIEKLDDNVTIKILLDGEFPAGFKRLQTSVENILQRFTQLNNVITYTFEDPTQGTDADLEKRRKVLAEDNIIPITLSYYDGKQLVQKPVFPFAIVTYRNKKHIINLLEEQKLGDDEDIILNKSITLLEYKFSSLFNRLLQKRRKNILFTTGNGEWHDEALTTLDNLLKPNYNVGRVNLDSLMYIDSTIDLLVVSGIREAIDLKNIFKIDQYIMSGGKILWLLDKYDINLDSLNGKRFYIPEPLNLGIDDLLFKYGARIQPNLILDLDCSRIPQVAGMSGNKPQIEMFPWYYHMVISPTSQHPIVKNIDRLNVFFPSTIDTIKTSTSIVKIPILTSSRYTRTQLPPIRLTFDILTIPALPEKFNNGIQTVGLILEGQFESMFKNRLTSEFEDVLNKLSIQFKPMSPSTRQIIVSDSEISRNLVASNGDVEDIGLNKWERTYYKGNKDFLLNAIEYLIYDQSILTSRSKEIKLRLLDKVKTRNERIQWQFINVGMPLILLFIFGFIFNLLRKKRYT